MATDLTSSTRSEALRRQNVDALLGHFEYVGTGSWSGWPRRKAEFVAIRAFAGPLLVQAAGLAKGARALALTDELSRIDAIKGQSSGGVGLSMVSRRRGALGDTLAACPVGRQVEAT